MNNDKLLKEIRKNQILAGMINESEDTTQVPDFDITGGAVKESTEEAPFEIQEFRFKVKHDNGVKKLKTKASSLEAAKQIIMNAEGCPEGALELVSEMKKTYGQEGKAEKIKYQKHLRPAGKKIANAATRKAGKEISKNAEKDIDEGFIREMIKGAIKENFESGDLKTNEIVNECLSNLIDGHFSYMGKKIIDEGIEWSKYEVYDKYSKKPHKIMYDTLDIAITLGFDNEENKSYDIDFIFKAVIYSKGSPETNRSMDPQNDTGSDPEYNTELKGIIIRDQDNKVVWSKNIEPDKNKLINRDLGGFENFFRKGNFDFDKELDSTVESYIINGIDSDGFREPEDMSGYRSSDVENKEFGGIDI